LWHCILLYDNWLGINYHLVHGYVSSFYEIKYYDYYNKSRKLYLNIIFEDVPIAPME